MFACQWTRVVRALLLATLLGLPAMSAHASTPTIVTTPFSESITFPAGTFCEFPVVLQDAGTVRTMLENGVPTMIQLHLTGSFSNPLTGKSLSFVTNITRTNFVVNPDGSTGFTDAGLAGMLTIPGVGQIGATVGRGTVTIQPNGQVTFLFRAGQFNDPFPAACQYLR
jgi:hypothetical protein